MVEKSAPYWKSAIPYLKEAKATIGYLDGKVQASDASRDTTQREFVRELRHRETTNVFGATFEAADT